MTQTRTAQLATKEANANVQTTLFTAAANLTTIVKTIYWSLQNGPSSALEIGVIPAGSPFVVNLVFSTTETAPDAYSWEGWLVLNPGDQIYSFINDNPAFFIISGTLLPPYGTTQ